MEFENGLPRYNGPGVYMIEGIESRAVYIGSSNHVRDRLQTHLASMESRSASNKLTNAAVSGESFMCFVVKEMPSASEADLQREETKWIRRLKCVEYGYNTRHTAYHQRSSNHEHFPSDNEGDDVVVIDLDIRVEE